MELRERYDPEDIETLLMERGFDELLEEERAYVLRHLSGREEYESMRMLLLHMRDQPPREESGPADPRVRTAVIDAFRSRRQPRMTIWLNSIGAALWPKEVPALWRPALAMASLALLLAGGWWSMQRSDLAQVNELAELKLEEKTVPAPPPAVSGPGAPVEALDPAPAQAQQHASSGSYPTEAERTSGTVREEMAETLAAVELQNEVERPAPPPAVAEDMLADREKWTAQKSETATGIRAEPVPSAPATSRTVTTDDLARNFSHTNSSPDAVAKDVRAKAAKALSASRNLADDEVLLSLLNSGW